MCEKIFKIKTIFFQTIQFFDGILYNILLLFGGLFISGGLRQPPKWPIASAGPALGDCWSVVGWDSFPILVDTVVESIHGIKS